MIKDVEYEKYDPKTPRLDYGQIASAIHKLPTAHLERLMLGPFETGACVACNACDVLEDIADNPSAALLIEWHDKVGYSERTQEVLKSELNPDAYHAVSGELREVLGTMVYAKCCTIYTLARVEIMERRRDGR